MRAAFLHSAEMEKYHYPPQCPFKTERAAMTRTLLVSMGSYMTDGTAEVPPAPATRTELEQFHAPAYLDALRRATDGKITPNDLFLGLGGDETPIFPGLYEYVSLAAGASIAGARMLLSSAATYAFNPSGGLHHAYPDKAGGFCYVNDIVLACKELAHAGKKVFCLDLDAHHGNGTQFAFYHDPRVLTISFHESGKTLYPWSGVENEIGVGAGTGYNVNIPFPPGADDAAYEYAFRQIIPPLLGWYAPDTIVLELGMDVLAGDPLTHLRLSNNAFADILLDLMEAGKPMLVTGGGGYNPEATARGWALAWRILCGLETDDSGQIGLGGTFLGSNEWGSGLREMRVYTRQDEREQIMQSVQTSVETIKKTVFALHRI